MLRLPIISLTHTLAHKAVATARHWPLNTMQQVEKRVGTSESAWEFYLLHLLSESTCKNVASSPWK